MVAAVVAFSATGVWAVQGDGLVPSKDTLWPRWQGRLAFGTVAPLYRADVMNRDSGTSLSGATLLGDYYFTRSLRRFGDSGGFRATSGVFLGSRSTSLLPTGPATGFGGRAFSVERRTVGGLSVPISNDSTAESAPVPYVGLGYTGLPSKGGWGFSADLGVMALSPGSAVKLGRVVTGTQSLDDTLRDMRLSPLVHLGVSYSF
jgi:hypothetical protein